MKFTIALPLTLATLGVAAPTIEKREVGTVTLYTATRYGGQSTTLTIDTNKEYIPGSDPPNLGCSTLLSPYYTPSPLTPPSEHPLQLQQSRSVSQNQS